MKNKNIDISVYIVINNQFLEKLYDVLDSDMKEINEYVADGYIVTEMNENLDFVDINNKQLKHIKHGK